MELPKNITQIGEVNPHCKIYVEDYVISYIRQLNQYAREKGLAVALYGTRKEEGEITYLFFYGACKLNFLQRECRHLSQAVCQEVEKQRRKYFFEYTFLGYRLLDGEMIEGFHVCEQNVCRYVEGYAQFYEKNDSMLAFMLNERQGDAKPEEVEQAKYDMVKKRQEERRVLAEERKGHVFRRKAPVRQGQTTMSLKGMRLAAAAVFVLLCVVGLASLGGGERLEQWQQAASRLVEGMAQKQLPDAMEVANGTAQVGTIVAEDKLADAILKENAAADSESAEQQSADSVPEPTEQSAAEQTRPPASEVMPESSPAPDSVSESMEQAVTEHEQTSSEPATAQAAELVAYIVQRGDTLTGICIRQYGSDARMAEIAALNNIANPDDIKEGEKIFLPQ